MAAHEAALAALARGDVAAVVALLLFTLLLAALLSRAFAQRSRRDAVLLLGPCGAGKTALFGRVRFLRSLRCVLAVLRLHSRLATSRAAPQLRDGLFSATVTSMAVNEARVVVRAPGGGGTRVQRLVDLPGHPRLRGLLDEAAPAARALVYLVDGRDGVFLPAVRETAECVPGFF